MGSLPRDIDVFLSTKFTHLIIGGGTAGLVVAARLADNKHLVVGVLEAGPADYEDPRINVPGRFCETLDTDYDWQFATVPQPGLNGRSLPWARGKVLGGSSALNIMTWNRACKEDYDAWEELGNRGWGWDGLLYVPCYLDVVLTCSYQISSFWPLVATIDTPPSTNALSPCQALLQEERDTASLDRKATTQRSSPL